MNWPVLFILWFIWGVWVVSVRSLLRWFNGQPSGTQGLILLMLPVVGGCVLFAVQSGYQYMTHKPETTVSVGVLEPGTEKDPLEVDRLRKNEPAALNAMVVEMGTVLGVFNREHQVVISVAGRDILSVTRIGEAVAVSALILDRNSDAIAVIEKNQFFVNPNRFFPRPTHPDRHTLVVHDLSATEVLRVRLLNRETISVRGRWQGRTPLAVTDKGIYYGTQGFEKFSVIIGPGFRPEYPLFAVK